MAMPGNRVIHCSVQDFFFRSFQAECAATLTGILAAVDKFSFGHRLECADSLALFVHNVAIY